MECRGWRRDPSFLISNNPHLTNEKRNDNDLTAIPLIEYLIARVHTVVSLPAFLPLPFSLAFSVRLSIRLPPFLAYTLAEIEVNLLPLVRDTR